MTHGSPLLVIDMEMSTGTNEHCFNFFWARILCIFNHAFSQKNCSLELLETDAHNVSILTDNGIFPAIILIQIGFTEYPLLISVSSFYESNTVSFLVSFFHMAINMFIKIEQRSTYVRKPLNLIVLICAITSTRYVVLKLFKPDGGTLSSLFKHFSSSWHRYSLMASSLKHLHHTG